MLWTSTDVGAPTLEVNETLSVRIRVVNVRVLGRGVRVGSGVEGSVQRHSRRPPARLRSSSLPVTLTLTLTRTRTRTLTLTMTLTATLPLSQMANCIAFLHEAIRTLTGASPPTHQPTAAAHAATHAAAHAAAAAAAAAHAAAPAAAPAAPALASAAAPAAPAPETSRREVQR